MGFLNCFCIIFVSFFVLFLCVFVVGVLGVFVLGKLFFFNLNVLKLVYLLIQMSTFKLFFYVRKKLILKIYTVHQ